MPTLPDQNLNLRRIKAMVGSHGHLPSSKHSSGLPNEVNCKVRLLDEEQSPLVIRVKRDWTGRQLFDEVCRDIGGLTESDYFGLRYLDRKGERQWLDLRANALQQLKFTTPCVVSFRVKHYPPTPSEDLRQEMSRYFLYLQLRRDLQHGRFLCAPTDAQELAAYVTQAELGDSCDLQNPAAAISELRLMPNMSAQALAKVCDLYSRLKGLVPAKAEAEFLAKASRLDTYGVDPYPVKDQKGNTLYLGLTHEGVATFRGNRRSHLFRWSEITKFGCEGRIFIIHVTLRDENSMQRKKKHVLGFKCQSRRTSAAIWKWAIDRQYFFTLSKSSDARRHKCGGGFLRRGNTFRFSGRCREETLVVSKGLQDKPQPEFLRTSSLRHIPRKYDTEAAGSCSTYPRRDNSALSNGSTNDRPSGNSVHFLLTSTPVKKRTPLQLHQSADQLSPSKTSCFRETNVDRPSAVSDPQLQRSFPPAEQFPGEESCVAVSGVSIESELILAPLATSQVTLSSSAANSSDISEIFDEMPRMESAPQLAVRRRHEEVHDAADAKVTAVPAEEVSSLSSPAECGKEEEEDSRPVPIWKAALVVLFVFIFLSLLGSILVFEGEMHSTALNRFRSSSVVEGVFRNVYQPLRRSLLG